MSTCSRAAWISLLLLFVLAITFLASPVIEAGADSASNPNYTVYGGCGLEGGTPPSHLCHKGDALGAFFQSNAGDATYDVCVRFPTGHSLCARAQQALASTLYVNKITSGIVGRTTITWFVNSEQIGSWSFGLYPEPVVAKFGLNPLFVAGKHRLFGMLIRYGGNGPRVRAWTTCGTGNICPLGLRLLRKHEGIRHLAVSAPPSGASFSLGATLYVLLDAPGQTDDQGSRIWGRLYTGKFVRAKGGRPGDTAIRHLGELRCVPPGKGFRQAVGCDRAPF